MQDGTVLGPQRLLPDQAASKVREPRPFSTKVEADGEAIKRQPHVEFQMQEQLHVIKSLEQGIMELERRLETILRSNEPEKGFTSAHENLVLLAAQLRDNNTLLSELSARVYDMLNRLEL